MAKHPVPKKKTSKARGSRRYKGFQNRARKRLTQAIQLVDCTNCKAKTRLHHVCPECGFYRGKDMLSSTSKPQAEKPSKKEEVTTIKAD